MRKRSAYKFTPEIAQGWQKDSSRLNTPTGTVQFWSAGGSMMTALMPIEKARQLVDSGLAYVVTSQAISQYSY